MATNPQASDLNRGSVLRALPRRIFQQSWTKNLFARMGVIIAENALNGEAKRNSRWGVRRILTYAESDGLNSEHEITPAWLAGFPPKNKERHREYVDRAHVARLLQNLGLWSQENLRLFEENLSASTAQLDGQRATIVSPRKPISSPPNELCNLVRHLAHNCGLSTRELRWLHVTDIQSDGLRIRPARAHRIPARVIPFGSGWDLVSKPLLDTYGSAQEPKECLFFSRSPRDKKKSISRQTLEAAIAKLGGDTITALREQHFREDFNRARSPLEARFHLRNVHGLSNVHVHTLIASFANEAVTVPMPASYPLVALCASRSIPEGKAKVTIPEGGERYVITWSDLLGYEITVDWKRSFA